MKHETEAEQKIRRLKNKIDETMEYGSDRESIQELIVKIEGTESFWYLLSLLVEEHIELKQKNNDLKDRVEKIESLLSNMGKSFDRNEYGF